MAAFRRAVWVYYRKHGRHNLPWRKTTNPYRLLVSEVMLQQTQVERVVPFYRAFLKQFPTAQALAEAPLARVLLAWQGLGYNRRAKMLQAAARAIAVHGVPRSVAALEELSGVGPYTARAVAAFAWNTDEVLIETNIRTAGIHHFFPQRQDVSDTEIKAVLTRALPPGRSREWHWALMDYGAYLKHSGISYNTHSRHYTKQSKFTGSFREARGVVLRTLAAGPMSAQPLYFVLGKDRAIQVKSACRALMSEALIKKVNRRYQLPT
ncbi:MAG TPA: A/G-specific adenine glycosylase [Candidatus Paceibacterota bacterium]|nr:A/G-specific adenine glycosylase [Candidatus Paceibacterota bacterium]